MLWLNELLSGVKGIRLPMGLLHAQRPPALACDKLHLDLGLLCLHQSTSPRAQRLLRVRMRASERKRARVVMNGPLIQILLTN